MDAKEKASMTRKTNIFGAIFKTLNVSHNVPNRQKKYERTLDREKSRKKKEMLGL